MTAPLRIVSITADELRELIASAVRDAIGHHDREWIGPDEVAAMLGVERSTIASLVRRDGLPVARVGRAYRFRRVDVLTWLEERMTRPGAHSRHHGAKLLQLRGRS